MKKIAAFVVALMLMLMGMVAGAGTAFAGGSDSPTPYSVSDAGVTLPGGETFQDNGHVNVKANQGNKGIHFESRNNQPSGQWIGKNFLPWSAFGYDTDTVCVTWVQLSQYNEHFGEGGQKPVGKGCETTPTEPPSKYPYEVNACWKMLASDGVEGTYEWPQVYVGTACDLAPKCETVEYQFDVYWIRDESDEALLEQLKKDGLAANSSDAALEAHGYYSKLVPGNDDLCTPPLVCPPDTTGTPPDCEPTPPTEPPTTPPTPEEPPVTPPTPEEPPVVTPPTPEQPVVPQEPKQPNTPVTTVLPATGADDENVPVGVVGIVLVILGGIVLLRPRRG
jgi:LPXTG-motif cell wall-anchored protein